MQILLRYQWGDFEINVMFLDELHSSYTCLYITVKQPQYIYTHTQGPPKKCIHILTKENSTLYNRLL
jgi:hypothetical protein